MLRTRGLPALVLLTEAVAPRLASTASALGLAPAGRGRLVVYCPSPDDGAGAQPPGMDRFQVEVVGGATGLGEANRLAEATGLSLDALTRVVPPATLDTPGVSISWRARSPSARSWPCRSARR